MTRLIRHTEEALYTHECVVIPNFGAFIRHDKPSELDNAKGLIYPGHSELSFNADLNGNDGILIARYREAYALNYKHAMTLLDSDVTRLQEELQSMQTISFGTIGRLSMDPKSRTITFMPNADHPFSTAFFGLSPIVKLPEQITTKQELSTPKKEGYLYIPIHLKSVKYGAVAVALLALATMIPNGSIDMSERSTSHAGLFTAIAQQKERPQKTIATQIDSIATTMPLTTGNQAIATVPTRESVCDTQNSSDTLSVPKPVNEPSCLPITMSEREQIAGLEVTKLPLQSTTYFVIIASLSNKKQVEEYVKYNDLSNFDHKGIIYNGSRYRVFAETYDNMEAAQTYLNTLTKQEPFASAWIYKTK